MERLTRERERLHLADAAVVLGVPALLVAVYALPAPVKRSLTFDYVDPTVATALASHFVHFAPGHLFGNAAGYLLAAPVGLALCALAGYRRLFYVASITYLGCFPFALSALNLAVPRTAVGYGFSGVVMAFVGFAPVAVCLYTGGERAVVRGAPALFFLSLVPIGVLGAPRAEGAVVGAGLLAGVYGVSLHRRRLLPTRSGVRSLLGRGGHAELVAVGTALPLLYPFVGFAPRVGATVPNLYAHLLGYCLGFVVPYAFVAWFRSSGRGR